MYKRVSTKVLFICILFNCSFLCSKGFIDEFPKLYFHNSHEMIDKIKEIITSRKKGALLRFGDGDLYIAKGGKSNHQKPDKKLAREMREAFQLDGPSIMKTLPIDCVTLSDEAEYMPKGMKTNLKWAKRFLNHAKDLWPSEITDVYSTWSLPFLALQHSDDLVDFFRFLKSSNCCLLIGNSKIPRHLIDTLFGKDCHFIKTPGRNTYKNIDKFEMKCLENIPDNDEYKIIITSMGCPGRVLQKRLWKKLDNVFFFDFGSLMDALCGWKTRRWIRDSKFDGKYFVERLKVELN